MKMPIFPDALVNALLGYGVVFVGLILLMAVVVIMGKVMTARKAAPKAAVPGAAVPAAPVAAQDPAAPGSAGDIKLYGVSDKDAAMIMAIVADKLGVPLNELRFKSIKEVK